MYLVAGFYIIHTIPDIQDLIFRGTLFIDSDLLERPPCPYIEKSLYIYSQLDLVA